ncbi:MAG: hypothetical protein GXO79_10940 [Chlorobi bacterium]|nr:hypothetical protein [Chlorobiota bacterium]
MNIQARKIEFVQEFLKLQSEDIISSLEKFLKMEKELVVNPMTTKELNKRIELSESDFENGNYKSNSELKAKYK